MEMGPDSWTASKIQDIANTATGGTPLRRIEKYYGGDVPWVKSGELDDNFIGYTEEYLTTEGISNSSAKVFPKGILLVALYGATVGKTAILDIDAATNQAVCAIFPKKNMVSQHFLRYFMMHIRPELLAQRYGGAQPNISQTIIRNIELIYPPLPEQRRIAAVLSLVQRAIEQQERLIELTTELKKALMQKLFTEGTRGEPQKQTEIGPIPESWEVVELESVLRVAQYGLSVRADDDGAYPMLRMTNQVDGKTVPHDLKYVNLGDEDLSKFRVVPGDVLFNRTNSFDLVGRTAIYDLDGDYVFASYLIRLRMNTELLNPYFLNHYFNWDATQVRLKTIASRAVSQSNISATRLKGFVVPLPVVEEQTEIIENLDLLDTMRSHYQQVKHSFRDLFRTLLHQLMTAEIRVGDLDLSELGLDTEDKEVYRR